MYNNHELSRFMMRGVGEFTPNALQQLLRGLRSDYDRARAQDLVWRLIRRYCSIFLLHARKWTTRNGLPSPDLDPLVTMIEYHNLWEGWHCDEPYHNSANQLIHIFSEIHYRSIIFRLIHYEFIIFFAIKLSNHSVFHQ